MTKMSDKRLRSASVYLTYHSVSLKRADVELLDGTNWINDQIIAFYFEYLENDVLTAYDKRKVLLVSPQVTQCLKLGPIEEAGTFLEPLKARQKKFIFFPLNDQDMDQAGGSHWSLLVFSRPEKKFFCFDSLNKFNDTTAEKMFLILKEVLNCPEAIYQKKRCRQQSNTYDCGLYVLINVDELLAQIINGGDLEDASLLDASSARTKRQDLRRIIEDLTARP
jgi:sentrin-specific protease 8